MTQPGVFITTATGDELKHFMSALDKATNEWTARAAKGECGWVCADCCVTFPEGMPDECTHGLEWCTRIIRRDKGVA